MTSYMEVQPGDNTFRIVHSQDISAALEANRQMQNDDDLKREGIKKGWQPVANIPDIIVTRWLAEGIDVFNKDHWPAVMRKLRDPEYRYLRVTLGAI